MPQSPATGAGSRAWLHALRRSWWIILLLAVLVPGLVVAERSVRSEGAYRATATIAATELPPDQPGLARVAEAAFHTADVAERIRRVVPYGGDPALPPEAVTVEPIRDTVLFRVHASDDDPEVAAALANAAADALATELSDLGGLGSVELVDEARTPARRVESAASPVVALIGAVAALAIGLLVLLVRMSVERAVLTVDDLSAATGTSAVTEVWMPLPLGSIPGAHRLAIPDGASVLLPCSGLGAGERSAVGVALAATLARSGPVDVVLVGDEPDVPSELPERVSARAVGVDDVMPAPEPNGRRVVAFDVDEAVVDAVTDGPDEPHVVFVVGEGTSAARVERTVARHDLSGRTGAVLVRDGRRR